MFEGADIFKNRPNKKLIRRHENNADALREKFQALDSELDGERNRSYLSTFKDTLPDNYNSIQQYVESVLAHKSGNAICVDFGGIGTGVADGFTKNFLKQSIGVTIADNRIRWKISKPFYKYNDGRKKHKVLLGDILKKDTYEELLEITGGEKVDIIFERLLNGFLFVGENLTLVNTVKKWYKLLNEDGIMFIQVPQKLTYLMPAWQELINSEYGDVLEMQYTQKKYSGNNAAITPAFRLFKKIGAPDELPMLDEGTFRDLNVFHQAIIDEPFGIGIKYSSPLGGALDMVVIDDESFPAFFFQFFIEESIAKSLYGKLYKEFNGHNLDELMERAGEELLEEVLPSFLKKIDISDENSNKAREVIEQFKKTI